ncbi:hypothetical protein COLO4_19332 [Corchorus olitorius]|uniref:Uncharacterized protein n=1 Tax=Corchorus olitorius TaxID=93759 RepID=A0A1R3J5N2_9ROSI|nr:hypothetical protein COLO4_19332 [Corchorus olitorius]
MERRKAFHLDKSPIPEKLEKFSPAPAARMDHDPVKFGELRLGQPL